MTLNSSENDITQTLRTSSDISGNEDKTVSFEDVLRYAAKLERISVSRLQKKFGMSYEEAQKHIETMCEYGYVIKSERSETHYVNSLLLSSWLRDY